jgi:calcineurin-like phosphoesterase family protein
LIWFSADYHLSHKNIIKYCDRPFKDIEEMDKTILNNLEDSVKSKDILYYLGDLTFKLNVAQAFFNEFEDIEIHYIIGNHDNEEVLNTVKKYCKSIAALMDINIKEISITLCHYAMRVWNKSHLNAWQLYGHSHANLLPIGKQYDVGVDNNNFFPVSFKYLKDYMNQQPDNLNFILSE